MYFDENDLPYQWNNDNALYETVEADYTVNIPQFNDDVNEDQGRAKTENRLLDTLMSTILHPLNFAETNVPLDVSTDNVKRLLDVIESDVKQIKNKHSISYVTSKFQSMRKRELAGGKKGIGPFALATAHHVLAQFVDLRFAGKTKRMLAPYGISSISGIVDKKYTLILDWLSAMINAHVDTAKDPYIIRMNVVPYTYNMTAFLLRAGFGENTFLFLPQQILKDVSSAAENVSGYLDVDNNLSEFKRVEQAVKDVYDKYENNAVKLAKTKVQKDKLRALSKLKATHEYSNIAKRDYLTKHLNNDGSFDWYYNQLIIYKAFETLSIPAKSLSELTTLSQIDTKKFGNNFSLYDQFLARIKTYLTTQKVFGNASDIFKNTFLLDKAKYGIEKPIQIMRNKILRMTDQFSYYRKLMLSLTGGITSTDETYIRAINRYLEVSIKNKFFADRISEDRVKSLLYGEDSIPSRLRQIKSDILANKYPKLLGSDGNLANPLLESINKSYKYDNVDLQLPDFIKYAENKTIDDSDNQMILGWEELLDLGNDPDYIEIGKFARDLVDYAYLTSGDTFGPNTLFSYVPNSYRDKIGYTKFMEDAEQNVSLNDDNMNVALKHLWMDGNVVPLVEYSTTYFNPEEDEYETSSLPSINMASDNEHALDIDGTKYGYPLMFTNTKANSIGVSADNIELFPIVVKVKIAPSSNPKATLLYKLVAAQIDTYKIDKKGNAVVTYKPVYRITNKLGLRYKGNVLIDLQDKSSVADNNTYGHELTSQQILRMGLQSQSPQYVWSMMGKDIDGEPTNSEVGKTVTYKTYIPKNMGTLSMSLDEVINKLTPLSKSEPTHSSQYELTKNKTYNGTIEVLNDNQVFVFGSNTEGRHGKGAALTAKNKFGAIYGQSEGSQGQSYAIITKDLTKTKHPSRTEDQIKEQISKLYAFARQNPDKEFMIAYSATGLNLNDYSNQEMANMFSSESIPNNVIFEDLFSTLVFNERNFQMMVEISTAKLQQHPELEKGIIERGGMAYLNKLTPDVFDDEYWETGTGPNKFIEALTQAFQNVTQDDTINELDDLGEQRINECE